MERQQRIQTRKGKIALRPDELRRLERETARKVASFDVECLMTCFAYSLHKHHKWGYKRIFRVLDEVDQMFGRILNDDLNVTELRQQLKDEVGIEIHHDLEVD